MHSTNPTLDQPGHFSAEILKLVLNYCESEIPKDPNDLFKAEYIVGKARELYEVAVKIDRKWNKYYAENTGTETPNIKAVGLPNFLRMLSAKAFEIHRRANNFIITGRIE